MGVLKYPSFWRDAPPTFREQGVDAVYYAWRGFIAPGKAGRVLAALALFCAIPALVLYSASLAVFALVLAWALLGQHIAPLQLGGAAVVVATAGNTLGGALTCVLVDQLRTLGSHPLVTIGGHTESHPELPRLERRRAAVFTRACSPRAQTRRSCGRASRGSPRT